MFFHLAILRVCVTILARVKDMSLSTHDVDGAQSKASSCCLTHLDFEQEPPADGSNLMVFAKAFRHFSFTMQFKRLVALTGGFEGLWKVDEWPVTSQLGG